MQSATGGAAGIAMGSAAVAFFLRSPVFASGRAAAREVLASARPSTTDFFVIAAVAGFGEELLFRAALQPWIGLAGSSAAFVLIHYWVPVRGAARAAYAALVAIASVALGVTFAKSGVLAAMVEHAAIDAVILPVAARSLFRSTRRDEVPR